MKLNKKGISIIELIISISLISIVMLFMYRLLADVTFEKDNEFFASRNQDNRIEIINAVQYDLRNKDNKVSKVVFNASQITFTIKYGSNTKNCTLSKSTDNMQITYTCFETTSWKMAGATLGDVNCKSTEDLIDSYKVYECIIPIYTGSNNNSKNNNNTIDDLVFSFMYEV